MYIFFRIYIFLFSYYFSVCIALFIPMRSAAGDWMESIHPSQFPRPKKERKKEYIACTALCMDI